MKNIRQFLTFSFLTFLVFGAIKALAQDIIPAPILDGAPTAEEIGGFISSLKGLSGSLAIALAIAQGLILLVRFLGLFKKLARRWAFVASAGIHVLVAILTLKVQGYDWAVILANSAFLTLLGNYLFQGYQMFLTDKGSK